jgi:hypothetical protein
VQLRCDGPDFEASLMLATTEPPVSAAVAAGSSSERNYENSTTSRDASQAAEENNVPVRSCPPVESLAPFQGYDQDGNDEDDDDFSGRIQQHVAAAFGRSETSQSGHPGASSKLKRKLLDSEDEDDDEGL